MIAISKSKVESLMVSNKSIISNLFCLFMNEVYEDIQD